MRSEISLPEWPAYFQSFRLAGAFQVLLMIGSGRFRIKTAGLWLTGGCLIFCASCHDTNFPMFSSEQRDNFVCFAIICCSKDDSFTFNEHLSTLRALEGVKNYKIGKSNRAISSSSTSGLSRFSFSNSLKSRYVSTLPVCENTFHVKFNIKTPPFFIRSSNATSNILILS